MEKMTMLPGKTKKIINEFIEQSKTILQTNLVGVYLHGSAVMGCFNPLKSDLAQSYADYMIAQLNG